MPMQAEANTLHVCGKIKELDDLCSLELNSLEHLFP